MRVFCVPGGIFSLPNFPLRANQTQLYQLRAHPVAVKVHPKAAQALLRHAVDGFLKFGAGDVFACFADGFSQGAGRGSL